MELDPPTDLVTPREVVLVLACMVGKIGALTRTVGGRIGFIIAGEGGGRWLVDLDSDGGIWTEWDGQDPVADTTLRATAAAFAALVLDAGAVTAHRRSGELVTEGARSKLSALGELIAQSGNLISQRARAGGSRANHGSGRTAR